MFVSITGRPEALALLSALFTPCGHVERPTQYARLLADITAETGEGR